MKDLIQENSQFGTVPPTHKYSELRIKATNQIRKKQVDKSTSYPEVKTILKAKQHSKWSHEHPRHNKADPYYLLTRREQVAVFRFKTGHNRLNYHLYSKLRIGYTAQCPCGSGSQTTEHLLQSCPIYEPLRKGIWPDDSPVACKLYGSLEDLWCTATFIEETVVSIWWTRRRRRDGIVAQSGFEPMTVTLCTAVHASNPLSHPGILIQQQILLVKTTWHITKKYCRLGKQRVTCTSICHYIQCAQSVNTTTATQYDGTVSMSHMGEVQYVLVNSTWQINLAVIARQDGAWERITISNTQIHGYA